MPHAAIYWCNGPPEGVYRQVHRVSMPHAAIFWCNLSFTWWSDVAKKFQCRTRQFSGAILNSGSNIDSSAFQCRTRQFAGAIVCHRREYECNQVSMPHAAICWCNCSWGMWMSDIDSFQCRTRQFAGAISGCSFINRRRKRFNAARGNLLVQLQQDLGEASLQGVSMPHAAICWCNYALPTDQYGLLTVSMPHAAIYWCNYQQLIPDNDLYGFNAARGNLLVQLSFIYDDYSSS